MRHSLVLPLAAALASLAISPLLPATAAADVTLFEEMAIDVVLTGRGQSPAVASAAVGQCTGRLVPASGRLTLSCSSDLAGAGDVVLTLGSPSAGGTVVAVVPVVGSGAVAGGEVVLDDAEVASLLVGRLWVAVASAAHPAGEIAARLVPQPPVGHRTMRFTLRDRSLVTTGSTARGDCLLAVRPGETEVAVLCVHDVAGAQQLRVVLDGNVIGTVQDVASPLEAALPSVAAAYDRFRDGHVGLVLTSNRFPQGEIGSVLDRCLEGPDALCLNDDRFRVTAEVTPPGGSTRAASTVRARAADSGLFYFFHPANWELGVKVLTGCPVSGHYWVFLSANTNVEFRVTVYDILTGRVRHYPNAQGHLADPVADTAAFPCG